MQKMTELEKHLEMGTIYIEDQFYYIGRTSDGTEVQIGNVGSEDNIERYLADHPTPEDW